MEKEVVDLGKVFRILWSKRKRFYIVVVIVFLLSALYIFVQPRYYSVEVSLAPETVAVDASGGLASIASSFGFNLGNMASNDAIYPTLYPDLFESPEFLVSLLDIQVKTLDGELECDYYTYLKKYQKRNPYTKPIRMAKRWINKIIKSKKKVPSTSQSGINAFMMSEEDFGLVSDMQNKIVCTNDKRTDVTTIRVEAQDALVCALLADSISARLQTFITRYRTSKARMDLNYYQQLADSAQAEYLAAATRYSAYCDANMGSTRQAARTRKDQLENDMDLKLSAYQAYQAQVQAMRSKVQEKTPAFTTLKSATVPVKPAGPKRVLFVLAMCFLSCVVTALWLARKELHITF